MVFEERLRQVRRPNVYWVSSVANQPIHAARFVPTRRRSARYVAFTALISISNVEANRNRILSWGKYPCTDAHCTQGTSAQSLNSSNNMVECSQSDW